MPRPDMKIMVGLLVGLVTAILYMLALPLVPLLPEGMQAGERDILLAFLLGAGGGLWVMLRRERRRPPAE